MGSPALVDTNILIDFLAGVPAAARELHKHKDLAISVISRIELLAGVPTDRRDIAEDFLRRFIQIELTPAIVEESVHVRRHDRLKLPDAILLATAHMEKRVLLTRNTSDFRPGRFVRVPYQL